MQTARFLPALHQQFWDGFSRAPYNQAAVVLQRQKTQSSHLVLAAFVQSVNRLELYCWGKIREDLRLPSQIQLQFEPVNLRKVV